MWQKAHYELSLDRQGHAPEILSKLPRKHVGAIPPSVGKSDILIIPGSVQLELSVKKGDIHEQGRPDQRSG
jgi:hypothetical protein